MNRSSNMLMTLALSALVLLGGGNALALTLPTDNLHTCTVRDVLTSGSYIYIRCQEGSRQIWLATIPTRLAIGEQISYVESPPMINFHAKELKRTFPEVHFVAGIARPGDIKSIDIPAAEVASQEEDPEPPKDEDSVFSGTDGNGTLVFTDDPAKAPEGAERANSFR